MFERDLKFKLLTYLSLLTKFPVYHHLLENEKDEYLGIFLCLTSTILFTYITRHLKKILKDQ